MITEQERAPARAVGRKRDTVTSAVTPREAGLNKYDEREPRVKAF